MIRESGSGAKNIIRFHKCGTVIINATLCVTASSGKMRRMIRFCARSALIVCLLAGCNLSQVKPKPTSDPISEGIVRLLAEDEAQSIPAKTEAPDREEEVTESENSPYLCSGEQSRSARRVSAVVDIDYAEKTATVDEGIFFENREQAELVKIVIDVQPNQWEGSFLLEALEVKGAAVDYDLKVNRLEIALPESLPPGCAVEINLRFQLRPESIRAGLRSYRGFFGYSARQLNLAHFLPTVAARVNGDWRIHEPLGIGEQIVYDIADWDIDVNVRNGGEGLQLAAPGNVKPIDSGQWRVELPRSRDFAISLSEQFELSEGATVDGTTIRVFSFPDNQTAADPSESDSANHTLRMVTSAMELFTKLFGDYPYEQFVIVQGDFPDGMEFTGLAFVGSAWFSYYDGTPYNYLTLIAVHELAHQWWYAQVGNDAALHPWLDEALATYSEYLFIESRLPADKNWWWTFRIAGFFPQGKVDSAVYEFTTAREYINAIYLRGVQMLHNLRENIGDEQFFGLLKSYLASGTGRIVEPSAFWVLLPKEHANLTLDTRHEFLRDPTVNALFADLVNDEG